MSGISTVFTNILAKTPLSASFGKVLLPSSEDEPLVTDKAGSSLSEKCEFRIEGMTCGACVEVSAIILCVILWSNRLLCSQSKASSGTNRVFIRLRSHFWLNEGLLNMIPPYGIQTNSSR